MRVEIYTPSYRTKWDLFVNNAKNTTFLFKRDFIEYHKDRFKEFSLLLLDETDKILSILPGNLTPDNILISHQGLTYGGLITPQAFKLHNYIQSFYLILEFIHKKGIQTLRLKCFPQFFNVSPTDEIEYILFLLKATLFRRDVAFVIDQFNRIPYSGNIRREGNKAEKSGAYIKEDDDFDIFWEEILTPNLMSRFGVQPVHSLSEIKYLKSQFPTNIKQYNVYNNNEVVAGTTMFLTDLVAHCQYISASDTGRKNGSLNFLFKQLIDQTLSNHRHFDFGIVNEDNGTTLNSGMLFWKESFGGRSHKHDFYDINPSCYDVLETYLPNGN